jgi:hypothetical protein
MCGKALPELVKQASRTSAPPPNVPLPGAPPARPVASATSAVTTRHDNPNRDLSYLLHDDHVPARTSRVPLLVGGLVLAAVAAFFGMRGGGKTAPATGSGTGDTSTSQTTSSTDPAVLPSEAKVEPPAAEPPKTETTQAEDTKTEPPPDSAKAEPVKTGTPPAAAHPKPPARPATAQKQKKPSPAKLAAVDTAATASSLAAPGGDCEKQLPSLRKAAARGDAKGKADLGLAYYVGRCVPRDLPTAYHFYALALRIAPDSPQVSAQLEAIWKQMSPAERQLALKAQ